MIDRSYFRRIVEDNTTRKGRIFDYFIQTLIILSLIAFSIETLPNNPPPLQKALSLFEGICVIIFSVEYLLRIWVARKPFRYIFSFYGIIDLLAILPFYLPGTVDLRYIRAFRTLRIFRSLKLIRYIKAINRFHKAAVIVKEEVALFLIVSSIFVFLAAAGIYFFEHEAQPDKFASIFHSLWWAVVTLTTVGYGDVFPITVGGRIFTFFILIVGVGIVTVPAGLVATALSRARQLEDEKAAIERGE